MTEYKAPGQRNLYILGYLENQSKTSTPFTAIVAI